MREIVYQQCTRCVMDTSDPGIAFVREGHCTNCIAYAAKLAIRASLGDSSGKLAALVQRIKQAGRGAKYDCVIGISGGADSCYTAYIAAKHGLRVLAAHMDNGWNTALAVKNIKTVVDRLGLDYTSCVLDWEEFKELQLSFFKASVPEMETPTDIAIPAALHQIAAANGIRFIVSGGNIWTEGILPKSWHYDAKDLKYLRAIHGRFGSTALRGFPTFGYLRETYYKLIKGIHFAYLLEHVPYTTQVATKILQDELGWQSPGGKHHESIITRFVQSYVLPVKFNIDYRRATFSTQICAGDLTRETALEELKKPPFDPGQIEADKRYVAKKFGITIQQFEEILAAPPKTYEDYPNDKKFLELLYGIYRKVFSSIATVGKLTDFALVQA